MKSTPLLPAVLFFIISLVSYSQPNVLWEKTFGEPQNKDDIAKYVLPTSDGHFLMVGTGFLNSDQDVFVVKVNGSTGNELWRGIYDQGNGIEDCFNSTTAREHPSGYVIAFDPQDETNQDNAIFMVNKLTGGVINDTFHRKAGTGSTCIQSTGISDRFMIGSAKEENFRHDARVQVLNVWTGSLITTIENPSGWNWGWTLKLIKRTSDGGYLLFGEGFDEYCVEFGQDVWVCKLDDDFDVVWSKFYGEDALDHFKDAVITPNNGFILLGSTPQDCFGNAGPNNVGTGDWIMELNSAGNVVQNPVIVSGGNVQPNALSLTPDNDLLISGQIDGFAGVSAYLDKVTYQNSQVNPVWPQPQVFNGVSSFDRTVSLGVEMIAATEQIICYGYAFDDNNPNNKDFWITLMDDQGVDCSNATMIKCGDIITDTNNGAQNQFSASHLSNCFTGSNSYAAGDKLYEINVTEEQQYKFFIEILSGFDLDLFLLDECGNTVSCSAFSVEHNFDSDKEGIDVVLQQGTYYLVVDGKESSYIGSYELTVSCDCSCIEPSYDLPDGTQFLCDNFEDYLISDELTPQSTRWRRWNTTAQYDTMVLINDDVVLKMENNGNDRPDIIYQLGDQTSGRYRISWAMFIEEDFGGYFNMLHENPNSSGNNATWAYEVYFPDNDVGWIERSGSDDTLATFPFKHGYWNSIVNIIDIDKDSVELWVNNRLAATWDLENSLAKLDGINFYTPDDYSNKFYINDLCVWQPADECFYESISNLDDFDPVCTPSGKKFETEFHARCDGLHISKEFEKCFSVCDKGGTFMYRGHLIEQTLEMSDFTPAQLLTENCITDEFNGLPNIPMFSDTYIFFNDSLPGANQEINITLDTINGETLSAFLFSCECVDDPDEGIICTQTCHGSVTDFASNTPMPFGLYYLVVIGEEGAEYGVKITPSSPCDNDFETLVCNTGPFTGTLVGEGNNFDTLDFELGDYGSCYDGDRSYEGNDVEYRFILEQPSVVDITLAAADAELGLFLYSFLCGRDCIAYTEIPENSDTISLDSLVLDAGIYYLVVDKESGINDTFSLDVKCTFDQHFIFNIFDEDYIPYDSCSLDMSVPQEVHINENAYNFDGNTNIVFMTDAGFFQRPVVDSLWKLPVGEFMPFLIYADDSTNLEKCSYYIGDSLKIRLVSNNSSGLADITFDPINPNAAIFDTTGNISTVTGLDLGDLDFFQVDPSFLSIPASGTEDWLVKLSSTLPWKISEVPEVPWVFVEPDTGITGDLIEVDVFENTTQFPRETVLSVKFHKDQVSYFQEVLILQKGVCLEPTLSIESNIPPSQFCEGEPITLTAEVAAPADPNAYNYLWNTGAQTPSIDTAATDGAVFSVTIIDKYCFKTETRTITLDVADSPSAPESTGDKEICFGQTPPSVGVMPPPSGIVAKWYDAPAGGNYLGQGNIYPIDPNSITAPGTYRYYIEAENSNNCTSPMPRTEISLTVHDLPEVTASSDTIICPDETIKIEATATGTDPLSFDWDNNLGDGPMHNISPNSPTTYSVTTTDGNGCMDMDFVQIDLFEAPTVSYASVSNAICGENNGEISLTVSDGTSPYTFLWSNGSTSATASGLAPNEYDVTITDANGCSDSPSDSAIVEEEGSPKFLPTQDQSVCVGDTATITVVTVGGTGNLTYTWSDGLGTGQTKPVSPLGTTTYSVTVTDDNGCEDVDTIMVVVKGLPEIGFDGETEICEGDITKITAIMINGNGNYECHWIGLGNTCTQMLDTPANYTVEITDLDTECKNMNTIAITANPRPDVDTSSTNSQCDMPTGSATAIVTGGSFPYMYNWDNGGDTKTITNLSADAYTVIVTDLKGCTGSATANVKNSGGPEVSFQNNNTIVCQGTSVVLEPEVSMGNPPYKYEWSHGLPPTPDHEVTPPTTTTYSVTVTDDDECSNVGQVTVEVTEPVVISQQSQPLEMCVNDSVLMLPTIEGDYTSVLWQSENGGAFSDPTLVSPYFSLTDPSLTDITLTLTVEAKAPCPQATGEFHISVNPLPIIENIDRTCAPDLDSFSVTFTTGADVEIIYHSLGNLADLGNGNFVVSEITPSNDLTLHLQNTQTDCILKTTIQGLTCLCDLDPPCCEDSISFCEGESPPVIQVEPPNGEFIKWYNASIVLVDISNDGTYQTPGPGIYYAATYDPSTNCESDELVAITVTEANAPELIVLALDDKVCPGGSTTITASGTFGSILWNTGETSLEIDATIDSDTVFTATALLGMCSTEASYSIGLFDTAHWYVQINKDICFGEGAIITATSDDDPFPKEVVWSTGDTMQTLINIGEGQYEAMVTDQNDCEFQVEITLEEPPEIIATNLETMNENEGQNNGSITFDLSGGIPPFEVNLKMGAGTVTDTILDDEGQVIFTDLASGIYEVVIIDDIGCDHVFTAEIGVTDVKYYFLEAFEWKLFPNPTTGKVSVEITQNLSVPVTCVVNNIVGKKILETERRPFDHSRFELDLANAAKGVYIVQLVVEGEVFGKKLVVQ